MLSIFFPCESFPFYIEVLALYVDLNTRKVSEFENEKVLIMDNYIRENKEKFDNTNLKFSSKLKKGI